MLKPGNQSFLGGGLFADMFKDATAMVRNYIAANPKEWDLIVHDLKFREFFTVQGQALKNVPKGFDKEHPQAEFLKFKSWYLEYPLKDEDFYDAEQFIAHSVQMFDHMKSFNDYLNQALAGFQMPKR